MELSSDTLMLLSYAVAARISVFTVIGVSPASAFSRSIGVLLQHPVIILAAVFWITWSLFMTLFCIEGRYAVPQYSIADDMNVVNTVLRSSLLISQSLPARLLKTFNLLVS